MYKFVSSKQAAKAARDIFVMDQVWRRALSRKLTLDPVARCDGESIALTKSILLFKWHRFVKRVRYSPCFIDLNPPGSCKKTRVRTNQPVLSSPSLIPKLTTKLKVLFCDALTQYQALACPGLRFA